jgi:hypothetical protein
MHKYVNVALVFLVLILSVVTAAKSANDAKAISEANVHFSITDNITNLYKVSIAMSVFTAILLLMAIGAFHLNTKLFGMVKAALCVIILIISLLQLVFAGGSSATAEYTKTGIASGIFGLFAVGSCAFTAFKMMK